MDEIDHAFLAAIAHSFFAGEVALAAALSPGSVIGCRLDEANRELVLEGRRETTTPPEYP